MIPVVADACSSAAGWCPTGSVDARRRSPRSRSTPADRRPGRPADLLAGRAAGRRRRRWPGSSASSRCPTTAVAGDARPGDEHVEAPTTCGSPTATAATCCTASTSTSRPGERLAMVGPSGAGKSTLGRLLAGIHPPRTGAVTVGGVPLVELPLDDLRGHVALVTQEHHVFVGTLRDNLAAGPARRPTTATCAARWTRSTRSTGSLALPDGLDTEVGSGGRPLTPAQAQQLALARLVLADPHTLVLDEATSLIDPRAARHLERSLAAVLDGPHGGRDRAPAAHRARRRPGRGGRGRPDHRAGLARRAGRRPAAPTPRCGAPGGPTNPPTSPLRRDGGRGPVIGAGDPAPALQDRDMPGTAGCDAGTGATGWYGEPSGGRGSVSPRSGQNDIARSACAVMVSDGLAPRLAETAAPSTTCRPGWPKTRCQPSTTPWLGVGPDGAAAEEVRRHRRADQVGRVAAGVAVDDARPAGAPPRCRPGSRTGSGSPWPCRAGQPPAAEPPPAGDDQRVVDRLHDQRDDRALGPAAQPQRAGEAGAGARTWSASQVSQRGRGPSPSVRLTESSPIAFEPWP